MPCRAPRPPRSSQREDGGAQRGAALLEFSLVLPVLLVLMLGIVTTGSALNRTNSLNNAARESARYGATLPADNLVKWLNLVATVAQNSATGDLDDGVRGRTICVSYVYPNGTAPSVDDDDDVSMAMTTDHTATLTVDETGTKTYAIGSPCYADGRTPDERRVQVFVERDVELNFVFTQPEVTIDSMSTARFERTE